MYKKALVISLVVIAAGCAAAGGVLVARNRGKTPAPTIVEQKKNAPEQSATSAANTNKPAENVPVSPTLNVTQVQAAEAAGVVTASAQITGTTGATGTCVFTFANSLAKPVVRQVKPTTGASALSCATGDISNVEFSVIGDWALTVHYYDNDVQAVGTGSISIN